MTSCDELFAQMQGIMDGAEGRDLTEEELKNVQALDTQLENAKRQADIRAKYQAYATPIASALHVGTPKPDNGLEKAFDSYLRTGKENADLAALRPSNAQSEGVGSEGGFLVPEGFRQKLVDRMKAFGGIANVAQNITTTDGRTLPWVTIDDTSNVGEIVEENGTFTSGADLVFGSASLGAYSYMAGGAGSTPLRLPRELLQDAGYDVQGIVSDKLGERIARLQATHLVTGNGVKQPLGIVFGLTGVEMSSGGPTYDDLVTYIHSVDPAYRNGARWAFNDASLAAIKKIKDSHGDPIWRPADANMATDLGGGTLLGFPVTIDQAFGNIVGTNGADDNWGVFGNLAEGYVVRRVRQVEILVNPWTRQQYRQIEFTAWARMDATQQNTNAYVALAGYTA